MCITFTNKHASQFNSLSLARLSDTNREQIITLPVKCYVRRTNCYQGDPSVPDLPRQQASTTRHTIATEQQMARYCAFLRDHPSACLVPFHLAICIGAEVMLLKNLDFERHLINGSRGTVQDIIYDDDGNAIVITVLFRGQDTPVPISRMVCHCHVIGQGDKIQLFQFPIRLAWAVTAHKSQGQTLSRVAIDVSETAFAHGAFYVALSRVRRIEGLLLFGAPQWTDETISYHINNCIFQQHALTG